MKYYNIEKKYNDPTYMEARFFLCPYEYKPTSETHILSINCTKCKMFVRKSKINNEVAWIDCKYFDRQIRKLKLEKLENV